MSAAVAWLAGGRIHVRHADGVERTIESRFGETVVERALQIQRRHAWKDQGRGAQFRGLLWSGPQGEAHPGLAITSLTRGERPGELLYALETREIAGVFAVTADGADERRLFHGNERRVRFLASRPSAGHILCSQYREGTASVAMMNPDGGDLTELTEGDSLDLAPSFEQGSTRRIVFQSAGIGRTKDGHVAGLGPFAIRRLDLDRGDIDTVAEDAAFDFLGPRALADGSTLAIRRPYEGRGGGASFWAATKDFLLFPARLLFALFQYLNFFSARYAGKPLTTAGGPKKDADMRQMMVWGNLMEATHQEQGDDDTPAVVPSSWTLVRIAGDGKVESLARGVLAFDVAGDGAVVYTNGNGIYRLVGGKKERIASGSGIEQVVALD